MRSKYNALKHGIFSKVVLLNDESRSEFDSLLNGLVEDFKPGGTLEDILVEKLAMLLWRHRRLVTAEAAEIRMGNEFLEWDEDCRQAESANLISGIEVKYDGGLIQQIANPIVLERCLELLRELQDGIREDGFSSDTDLGLLEMLYGKDAGANWRETLCGTYKIWSGTADCSEEVRQQNGYASPKDCEIKFLTEVEAEIKRLMKHQRARTAVNSSKTNLDKVRRSVPDAPAMDRLLRYEASIERMFDRTLSQLERLQRMRLGQPVPPAIKLDVSSS